MFQRKYTVKGEDVNDFMVMQNAAYLQYASKLLATFLYKNGFTNLKMNTLKVGLEQQNDSLKIYKPLFFTKEFTINMVCENLLSSSNKMIVTIQFYNSKDELAATLTRELVWFDYENWQALTPPNKLLQYFTVVQEFGKVG